MGGDSLRTSTSLPKQYITIANKEVFLYSFEIFLKNEKIDKIILVSNQEYVDFVRLKISKYQTKKEIFVISGGSCRQDSSFLALDFIKKHESDTSSINVIIHDSARPLLTTKVLDGVLEALVQYKAVTAYLPINDSICEMEKDENIKKYLSRNETKLIQTPQGFNFDILYKAHECAIDNKVTNASDDTILVSNIGYKIHLSLGDAFNFKITNYDDLIILERLIKG